MAAQMDTRSRRGRKPVLDAEVELRVLLDAGLAVLRRSGYERATLDEVLAESGLSTRALYRHFATKDDLLRAVFRRTADEAIAAFQARVGAAPTSLEALTRWIDEFLGFAYDPTRSHRAQVLGYRGRRSAEALDQEYARMADELLLPLINLLEAGRTDGTFPNAHPELDAQMIRALAVTIINAEDAFAYPSLARDDAFGYVMQWASTKLGCPPG